MSAGPTLWIKFRGYFQSRLATDPDPSDEPRGVSGYVRAVAGEPDLDRIIRLQPKSAVVRSHCPAIGVVVSEVFGDARHAPAEHPLVGAAVDLLDDPKFEGRNHILADDGVEAVVPCHIQICKDALTLQRTFADNFVFPPTTPDALQQFQQLQASGVNISPGAIGEATGVFSLAPVWAARTAALKQDLAAATTDVEKAALAARIASMADPSNTRFFAARMLYRMPLAGVALATDPAGWLPGKAATTPAWPLEFWCGAWDPDALCGYMLGYLGVPTETPDPLVAGVAEMMADRHGGRR